MRQSTILEIRIGPRGHAFNDTPRYITLTPTWEEGIPHPDLGWGTPILTWDGGTPHPDLGRKYPPIGKDGVALHHLDEMPPPFLLGKGYSPQSALQMHKCEQTENITFPYPSDAGGNYYHQKFYRNPIKKFRKKSRILALFFMKQQESPPVSTQEA